MLRFVGVAVMAATLAACVSTRYVPDAGGTTGPAVQTIEPYPGRGKVRSIKPYPGPGKPWPTKNGREVL